MLILAFDTTAAAVSVALWRDGAVLGGVREEMAQGQAEALIPAVERVMSDAGANYAALDRIAVTVGPGSFTGVRLGLAAARGLGLAAAKAVIGVLSTEVLAAAVPTAERNDNTRVLAAIDTKRGDLYVQHFDHTLRHGSDARAIAPDALAAWVGPGAVVVVGDAAALAVAALGPQARLSTARGLPDAAVLAQLAAERAPVAGGPLPVYIRPPEAVVPEHGGRLRP